MHILFAPKYYGWQLRVLVEAWTDGYKPEWDALRTKYPDMAPVNLGNMGYLNLLMLYFPIFSTEEIIWEIYRLQGL